MYRNLNRGWRNMFTYCSQMSAHLSIEFLIRKGTNGRRIVLRTIYLHEINRIDKKFKLDYIKFGTIVP